MRLAATAQGILIAVSLAVAVAACGSREASAPASSAGDAAAAALAPADAGAVTQVASTPDAAPPAPAPDAGPPGYQLAAAASGRHWPAKRRARAIAAGVQVIERHQCTRCHEIDGIAGAGRPYDCVACHQFLKSLTPDDRRYQKIAAKNGKQILDRYIANIEHYLGVPNLSAVSRRVRPEWIARYLASPYDVRPVMDVSMIRHRLTAEEIDTLARYFAAVADAPAPRRRGRDARRRPPSAERIAQGRKLFANRGCPSCHTYGNVDFRMGVTAEFLAQMKDVTRLAPNLRLARERVRPEVIVDWIVDPPSVVPGTRMPKLGVPREEAELLADFVLYGDVGELPPPVDEAALMRLPPAADHPVSWVEVKERVLGKVCVHCHMNDHEEDTGPGNRGGMGFPGIELSFRTYERTVWGAMRDGKRYSVLEPLPGEALPRILQVMLLRRVENRRDRLAPFEDRERPAVDNELLGMPLGLPAMTDEELGILRAWIEQGCPGPTEVTGREGFTDGYLVPDGPIAVNRGCQLRAPSDPPPRWASAPGWAPPERP